MAKRSRHKSAAARGRLNRARPQRYIVTPDHQSEIPFEERHKFRMLVYSNGRTVKRRLKKPCLGASIRSNMLTIMPLAMYKRSNFSSDEIERRRFRILEMNDDWRAWDEKVWMDKIIKKRRESALAKRITILSGLPSVSCR